jgi:hypothetical protein
MPGFSTRSRPSLLAVAAPLSRAARELFTDAVALQAADAVDAAVVALELELGQRTDAVRAVSAEAARVAAAERSLDRRARALGRALDGLAGLGDGDAEDLHAALFPDGSRPIVAPDGRAQAAVYRALADRLRDLAGHPGGARIGAELRALQADLAAWSDEAIEKDGVHRGAAERAAAARAATEALRGALTHLSRAVTLAAGGPGADAYRAWAKAAQGLG